MNFWTKLQAIDRRWIYLVVWVVVMVPLIFPFKIRPVATPPVQSLFNYIDTMPENKALILSVDYTPDTQTEQMEPQRRSSRSSSAARANGGGGAPWLSPAGTEIVIAIALVPTVGAVARL